MPGKSLAVEGGSRLNELDGGRNRGHAVMAIRGNWKLGANGCRGASWSEEGFGANSSTATSRRRLLLSGCQGFKDIRPLILTIWFADKCTRVLLYVVQKCIM